MLKHVLVVCLQETFFACSLIFLFVRLVFLLLYIFNSLMSFSIYWTTGQDQVNLDQPRPDSNLIQCQQLCAKGVETPQRCLERRSVRYK